MLLQIIGSMYGDTSCKVVNLLWKTRAYIIAAFIEWHYTSTDSVAERESSQQLTSWVFFGKTFKLPDSLATDLDFDRR